MRAVLVFCEGQHDVVFATRSLGAAGCSWVGAPIAELPSPFGDSKATKSLIAKRYGARALGAMALRAAGHSPVPAFEAMVESPAGGPVYAVIRNSGDTNAAAATGLIDDIQNDLAVGAGVLDISECAVAFLFDADTGGVPAREAAFHAGYSAFFGLTTQLGHGNWTQTSRGPVGLYVFHDATTGLGTLETHLAPMVQSHWPGKWTAADAFLTSHATPADAIHKSPAARLKAQISIAGQGSFPGAPMSDIIDSHSGSRAAAMLPKSAFQSSQAAVELVAFLQAVTW